MPFGFINDLLDRRETRDREKGYSEKYIQTRNNQEMWYVMSYALAIVTIAVVNLAPMGIPVFLCVVITVVALAILSVSFCKFLKSFLDSL